MSNKILFVDDEENILKAYERLFYKSFKVLTALGSKIGLEIAKKNKDIAVVVADMQMPEINGVQFLSEIKKKLPEATRIMLTGNADQETAVEAINNGSIFRFLTKPCNEELFRKTISSALEQHRLITAERELLEKTVGGSVAILTELMSQFDPDLFGKGIKIKNLISILAAFLNIQKSWELEIAAMLSQVGYLSLPNNVYEKLKNNAPLATNEKILFEKLPEFASLLISNIPRLETVSNIILYQQKKFNGEGFPKNDLKGDDIPLGARIIKPLIDLVDLEENLKSKKEVFEILSSRIGWYDPNILTKIIQCFLDTDEKKVLDKNKMLSIPFKKLKLGDILAKDIETMNGIKLLAKGIKISQINLLRLGNYSKLEEIKEPIVIYI